MIIKKIIADIVLFEYSFPYNGILISLQYQFYKLII